MTLGMNMPHFRKSLPGYPIGPSFRFKCHSFPRPDSRPSYATPFFITEITEHTEKARLTSLCICGKFSNCSNWNYICLDNIVAKFILEIKYSNSLLNCIGKL